jgi:hypothetical protein
MIGQAARFAPSETPALHSTVNFTARPHASHMQVERCDGRAGQILDPEVR